MVEIVEPAASSGNPLCRNRTKPELFVYHIKLWLIKQRRKLPYLVWYGDELDVCVTVKGAPLGKVSAQENVRCAEYSLRDLGISFDKGSGSYGCDWEWDWSLKGPISIAFRGRARKPELRLERPRPKLIVSNGSKP